MNAALRAYHASFVPDQRQILRTQLTAFIEFLAHSSGHGFREYAEFEEFCIHEFRRFWHSFLSWARVEVEGSPDPVCTSDSVEHAVFFPNLRLNYAENLLAGEDDRLAVISCHAGRPPTRLTRGELRHRVRSAAAALTALGIGPGDRVVAIAYNDDEAVVACLATAAIGATFSSAAPEMGARATLSRFVQLSPVALIAHTEQRSGNHLGEILPEIAAALPSLRCMITLGDSAPVSAAVPVYRLSDLIAQAQAQAQAQAGWTRFPFNHPLFILFSSGTTGAPKCIVHGAGGTLLEHIKEHRLHGDLRPGERLFFQTSCAWMMWNWQLSALACRSIIVLYDGPVDSPDTLWGIVAEHDVNLFGTSPAYLKMCETAGCVPRNRHSFPGLRAVLSTGSILYDAQYDWVLRDVKRIPVQSISGGTDIIGCFVLGNPNLPVWRGEAQCRSLGLDVRAAGAAADEVGDLVCANPFPSRPCGLFGDPSGDRFHRTYFAQNPGMWTHGDRIAFTRRGSARMHGRSDGVLNVRGIRVGPAEIYAALQDIPELLDALAVEQSLSQELVETRIVLLVVLSPEVTLTDKLVLRMRREITRHAGASHVPAAIAEMAELPTTHSGKRSEAAARDAVNGQVVSNRDALRNPDTLDVIANHPALRPGATPSAAARSGQSTEDVLRDIWASAFGVTAIGVDEDFFELGGDSLLAVLICTRIEEALGYDLQISTLFQAPTIAALAKVLDGGLVWQGDSPLVQLQEGAGTPVFLLHSVTGNVFEWHALLRRLQCDRPIYALQARGLNPAAAPADSVEAMAADYLELIRAREPLGPYILFGYSFGGILAYEVAVRLHRMGAAVELLGMLDAALHQRALLPHERGWFRIGRVAHLARRAAGFGIAGSLRHVWKTRTSRRRRTRTVAGTVLPPILYRVRVACEKAFSAYSPPPYPGAVSYFRSQQRRPEFCDPLVILRRRAGMVRVIDVPGSHNTMLHEPNVAILAVEISRALNGLAPLDLSDSGSVGATRDDGARDTPPLSLRLRT